MTAIKNMTVDHIGSIATEKDVEYVQNYLLGHGYTRDTEINDVPDADWKAACDYAATNDRINEFVREDCEIPEVYEGKAWKVWRKERGGAFWYIPEDDEKPGDENVIEGETGELFYLDREDAIDQWGEEESLYDLTHCESGVVIYPNGDAIICNWTQGGINALPRLFAGGLVYLPDENMHLVADAVPTKFGVGDFKEINCIHIENDGDAQAFVDAINKEPQKAWELPDGTIIVTPDGWN